MKVSYNWLRDYVDVKIDPKKFADILTMAGTNLASLEKIGDDYIFDFEITSNRADCLSVIGIAREAAAVLGRKLKIPKDFSINSTPKSRKIKETPFPVSMEAPDLCPRYTARIIRGIDIGPSPEWLKARIISAGLRPVNNIVDITNFVLLETGQPLHAFDLDRLNGKIRVRKAKKGERIITLDNNTRECEDGTLLIADENGPVAIAGVMGGIATEVSGMTKNILLESAVFNPISIRRTARAFGLNSQSSYRFERRIDSSSVSRASERAASLIEKLAGGDIGPLTDAGKKSARKTVIQISLKRMNSLLGILISKKEALKILKSLGFETSDKKGKLSVTVPGFRGDVKTEVDVAEEIARIFGYDNIPLTIPKIVGNTRVKDFIDVFQENVNQILTRLGLNEIITYSLISKKSLKALGGPESGAVTIRNPLSIDQEIMRPTMLAGMLGAISHNLKRKAKEIAFFEVGKIYHESEGRPYEEDVLSIGITGKTNFYNIKGILEKLFMEIGVSVDISFKKDILPALNENASSMIEHKGETVAYVGAVEKNVCKSFDIEKEVFFAEVSLKKLERKVSLERAYLPYGRFPSISRDVSLEMEKSVTFLEVKKIIGGIGQGLVKSVSLVNQYKGKDVPEGRKALLFRVEYRSSDRTLEDSEVEKVHSEIRKTLSEKLNISFR